MLSFDPYAASGRAVLTGPDGSMSSVVPLPCRPSAPRGEVVGVATDGVAERRNTGGSA